MKKLRRALSFGTVAVLLGVVVSGCFSEDPGGLARDDADGEASPLGGNATTQVAAVAVVRVLVDGNETAPVNGSVPAHVGVNLTFSGEGSENANGSFAWDFGDGSSGEGPEVVHAFAEPGDFNVTLSVGRGNATASSSVLVNVTAALAADGVVWTDVHEASGTLLVGNPNAPMLADVDYRDHPVSIVDVDPDGRSVAATVVRITLDGGGGAIDMIVYWRSPSGSVLATNPANPGTTGADHEISYEGEMVPGEYVVRVRLWTGAQASYDVRAEVDYTAA